jgi:PhoPQ-activated pathogenicity-related protein
MKPLLLCAAISFSLFAQNQSGHQRPSQTALDRYVAAPDSHYSWKLVDTVDGGAFRAYVLELTSQQYLTEKEVDRPIWKHWLTVIRPPHVNSSTGFLFITGGNNRAGPPTKPEMSLVDTAVTTKSIVSELRMVPNQPLKFSESNRETSEDASIAYTWDKFSQDRRREMADAAANDESRCAGDGCHSGIFSQRTGRADVDREVRGRGRFRNEGGPPGRRRLSINE